jgi:hypothetical protein
MKVDLASWAEAAILAWADSMPMQVTDGELIYCTIKAELSLIYSGSPESNQLRFGQVT